MAKEAWPFYKQIKEKAMRRTAAFLVAASALVLLQHPASAGGWWTNLDLHDQHLGIGETLTVKIDEVLYASIEEAKHATTTDFYAYLVNDFDRELLDRAMTRSNPRRWWRPLSPPIKVGHVTLWGRDANLARGRVRLTIPDIPPGRYTMMLCDEGCNTPLGNHIPIPVNIASDALAAQTARRLDNANERLQLALGRVRRDVKQAQRQLRIAETDAAEALDAVARLERRSATKSDSNTFPWIAYAGWFFAGAFASLVLARRSRKSEPPHVIIERIPDDASELTQMR
jgi:hypothetical protein